MEEDLNITCKLCGRRLTLIDAKELGKDVLCRSCYEEEVG
jgi:formylmethanofuran dehydrogenase subunit E